MMTAHKKLRFLFAAALLGAAGPACAAPRIPPPSAPAPAAAAAQDAQWAELWPGEMWLSGPAGASAGGKILVAYGGYRADESGAKNWAAALAAAGGFDYAVAVKGPAAVDYSDHKKLEANKALLKMLAAGDFSGVVIAAHSSGTYVAHELLAMLKGTPLPARTEYYGLDGAACAGCQALADGTGFRYACVAAKQGELKTPNYWSAGNCGREHFTVLDLNAGCTGKWCLHGALVNENAAAFGAVQPPIAQYYNDPALSAPAAFLGSAR